MNKLLHSGTAAPWILCGLLLLMNTLHAQQGLAKNSTLRSIQAIPNATAKFAALDIYAKTKGIAARLELEIANNMLETAETMQSDSNKIKSHHVIARY